MTEDRYDLSFDGTLSPEADPDEVRRRLMAIFKLSESGAQRLFTGRAMIVKRNVDAATAAQFQQVFATAGAVLRLSRVESADGRDQPGADQPSGDDVRAPVSGRAIDTSGLSLAPPGGRLEEPPEYVIPVLDLSHLSLVPGEPLSLEKTTYVLSARPRACKVSSTCPTLSSTAASVRYQLSHFLFSTWSGFHSTGSTDSGIPPRGLGFLYRPPRKCISRSQRGLPSNVSGQLTGSRRCNGE